MRGVLTSPTVTSVEGPADPALPAVATLLAASVPAACAGLPAYHAPGYPAFLTAAVSPPTLRRTLLLRTVRDAGTVRAVADWRVVGRTLLLNGIAVRPGDRGLGLGSLLLADGRTLAATVGCTDLALDVSADNPAARRLYERTGFAPRTTTSWGHPGTAVAAGTAAPRVVDWPSYVAHHTAYGFGDLTLTTGGGTGSAVVRVVGTTVRVPADGGEALLPALRELLPVTRTYVIRPGETGDPGLVFARFTRMSLDLRPARRVARPVRPADRDGASQAR